MKLDHESIMELIRKDAHKATHGCKPLYMVSSGRVSMPFTNPQLAEYWQQYLALHEVETIIYDLTNYNWETNLANIKFHDTSTEEGREDFYRNLNGKTILN